ncbi:MAG: PspC domain-containing protein [Chloroflexi bacterium]|nr:PspC domain-containing protein [Chloroflexota bacterium]
MYDTQGNRRGKRLYRSSREAMWSGVCGGLAEYFEMDPTLIRLIWVGATIATAGTAILGYIVMWFVVPRDPGAPIASGPVPTGADDPTASSYSPSSGSSGPAAGEPRAAPGRRRAVPGSSRRCLPDRPGRHLRLVDLAHDVAADVGRG